jgi:hypothetical protein
VENLCDYWHSTFLLTPYVVWDLKFSRRWRTPQATPPQSIRLEAFTVTELDNIFNNKPCHFWIKAQRFGDHLRLRHQGNDVKFDRWWCLVAAILHWPMAVRGEISTMYINIISCQPSHLSPDDGGGDGLRNVGFLSTTDKAFCPRRFYRPPHSFSHCFTEDTTVRSYLETILERCNPYGSTQGFYMRYFQILNSECS